MRLVENPHIEARVRFLTTEEGGRKSPAESGYRPHMDYGGGMFWSAIQRFPEPGIVQPGDQVVAVMELLEPGYHVGRLVVGTEFTLNEGPSVIARGVVTRTFPALEGATSVPWPTSR